MGVNGYQGSIRARDQDGGVFAADQQILDLIEENACVQVNRLEKVIIWTRPGVKFRLNNEVFEMGKTYMYEIWHADVESLQFVQDSPPETVIDFIIKVQD